MDPQNRRDPPTRAIAGLADGQYGVVGRRQLLELGLSSTVIRGRLRGGALIPLHRGVYAVGHRRLTRDGVWMAAVLAAGDEAVLSHRDAATLHGLGRWEFGRVEVTTPGCARSTERVRVFSRRTLGADDSANVAGIPVTSVARTLVDLAEVLATDRLARALSEAERTNVLDVHTLESALERVAGRPGPGHARLRAVLDELARHGTQLTRFELERRLRALVRDHGLPRPRLNAYVDEDEVDMLWQSRRVVVEADGWEFHRGRAAFARDRAKTNRLTLKGYLVLRFTHDEIAHRPAHVADEIRRALS